MRLQPGSATHSTPIRTSRALKNHRGRNWAIGFGVALLYTAAQATQLTLRVPDVPWIELYLVELPVWCSLVALSPAIFFVARRLPLLGPRAFVNFLFHLVPAATILLVMFFLIEATRDFVTVPLVKALGIAVTEPAIRYLEIGESSPLYQRALHGFRYYIVFFFFAYVAVVVFYHSVMNYRELMRARLRSEQLETLLARSQLDALKHQLQPHFLFNTLNTVSSLMSRDILLARRMLARLSDLLRQSLRDSARHEVTLRSELEFLDAYIEIQQARFGERLVIEKHIESSTLDLLVPRMILQPLVENSIRHGMVEGDAKLVISINASVKGSVLSIVVSDNGRGQGDNDLQEGVGIRNTRDRLRQLYRDSFELTLTEPAGGGFEVLISLPAREDDKDNMMEEARDIA